jgi:hypothetical protein
MSIANYSDLSASIAAWMHRSDLTTVIPDFIRLAEARMQLDLDTRQLDKASTLTTTPSINTLALPTDFNKARSLSMLSGGVTIVLDNMPPELLIQRWGSYTSSMPRSYSIRGSNLLLGPTPNGAYDLTLEYLGTIPGLTAINQTNDILTNYPDAYLHCCMIYGAQYIRDAEMVSGMESLYAMDVDRINLQNWGQSATMTMKQG